MFSNDQIQALHALKSIARDQRIKRYIQQSEDLHPLLFRAAQRFVAGDTREHGISKGLELLNKGYTISLEYIGENTRTAEDCFQAKNEFLTLISEAGRHLISPTISFDLSHIGLSVDRELAFSNVNELAEAATRNGLSLMISMEESEKTEAIIEIYKRAAETYSNVGITIQAHLHRAMNDILELLDYPGKIRIVKGAYQESPEIMLPRSEELNERYLQLVDLLATKNHPVSIATHDEVIIEEVRRRGYLKQANTECEMLYGIRSDLMQKLKEDSYQARVYLTYGTEWYLYLCHRLAEYPENIYAAIADIVQPNRTNKTSY
jgi:proline dehydrogenase